MTSKGHVIGGLALASVVCNVAARPPLVDLPVICDMVVPILVMPPFALVALALFVFGTLLPDCDIESSAIGRWFSIPAKHRTWTHSIWAPILLVGIFYVWQKWVWSLWLVFGYVVHLILDSWSVMGICWLYPYPGYREYASGARVKRSRAHRFFKWYHAGTQEETLVVGALVVVAVVVNYAVCMQWGDLVALWSVT